jgi:hypothetical protein
MKAAKSSDQSGVWNIEITGIDSGVDTQGRFAEGTTKLRFD